MQTKPFILKSAFFVTALLCLLNPSIAWAGCTASAGDNCSCTGTGSACGSVGGTARCNNEDGSFMLCASSGDGPSSAGGTLGGTTSSATGGNSSSMAKAASGGYCKCQVCPKGTKTKESERLNVLLSDQVPLCGGGGSSSSGSPGSYSQ